MVKVIDDPDKWGSLPLRRREHRSYPWDEWTDGLWREAVRGEDFSCGVQSFVTALYHHGRVSGKRVTARTDNDKVLFQLTRNRG
jgi:hypothetical protein